MEEINLKPIGYVKNNIKEPRFGDFDNEVSEIIVNEKFTDALKNIEDYLADQTHIHLIRKFLLSAYSLKWIYKRVKRNPDLTFDQLKKDLENEQKGY